ncbi:ribosomal protein S6 [Entophlyctis helioformis]|nr:ribosomal protein S6 [Entophlyctis helioformis]
MPLYELVVIARTRAKVMALSQEAIQTDKVVHKKLLKFCAQNVLDNNGVVRQFVNLGKRSLPYRMKRHQEIFETGSYYAMHFDSSPDTMSQLSRSLALNEDVVRHTVIKVGDSLKATTAFTAPEKL